ncbi:hypothetical protein CC78DRAFT_530466 [Lojkania enalia]|uniref:Uncharacterized protein n=1 Tax=Lojkania enalia TaxID=147567 RepID=A0A9P4KHW6_9PLEO|nr:hypothetical protein CC78DRAFT_530466 [Didymosphaeria enalia]
MRFVQTLSSLLLGAALTTSVLAAPKPADQNSGLTRREDLEDDIEADEDTWEKYTKACNGEIVKRADLFARLDGLPVAMGDSQLMDLPIGLYTENLKPCIGLVVTGNKKDDKSKLVRVLGHFTASRFNKEAQWQKFKGLVEDADLENRKGYISFPDLDGPEDSLSWKKDDEEMMELANEIEDELKDRMDGIVEGDAKKMYRPMNPASTMRVDAQNNVFVNEQPFP